MNKVLENRVKSVVIVRDSNGKVVNLLEVSTLPVSKINELKNEMEQNKAKALVESKQLLEKETKEKELYKARFERATYILAKQQFNELVEVGKTDTTKEFENMYDEFINGATFNEEIAPYEYKKILGRLK